MDSQRPLIITSAILAMVCLGLSLQLYQTNRTVEEVQADNTAISLERDQVLFDLEKLSFSYDTLSTENALMLAQIADQKNDIDRLVQQVKNGNWSLARSKKEAETLRGIMKGYVATIDSLNQLNLALIDENDQMRARVEEVQERNANLVERQENMEEMITAGQALQAAEVSAEGIRVLSNGRQRPTTRASRLSMVRVCFTLLENRIASAGTKRLHLQVTNESGQILMGEQSDKANSLGNPVSASREIDYNNERIDACIFFIPASMEVPTGIYTIRILEENEIIGQTQLVLS
jgi:chromosome segregation ATPase